MERLELCRNEMSVEMLYAFFAFKLRGEKDDVDATLDGSFLWLVRLDIRIAIIGPCLTEMRMHAGKGQKLNSDTTGKTAELAKEIRE